MPEDKRKISASDRVYIVVGNLLRNATACLDEAEKAVFLGDQKGANRLTEMARVYNEAARMIQEALR